MGNIKDFTGMALPQDVLLTPKSRKMEWDRVMGLRHRIRRRIPPEPN